MTQTLLTIDQVTYKALQLFRNSNSLLKAVERTYDSSFAVSGAKIGSTLRVRLPIDPTIRTGATLTVQDIVEKNATITLATQKGVDLAFTSDEKALSLDDYTDRVLGPSINNLAGAVAADLMGTVGKSAANLVRNTDGSGNTISPTAKTWLQAGAVLSRLSAPQEGRHIVMSYDTQANTVASLAGLLNPQVKISAQYATGMLTTEFMGFETVSGDQTTLVTTTPTLSSSLIGTVDGATQTGSTITVHSLSNAVAAGSVISFAGVYATNRVTKATTGSLAQFVVTSTTNSSGTTLHIYPAITPPISAVAQPYQTVTASPADGANIQSASASAEDIRVNLAFHKSAIQMVSADLFLPSGGVIAASRKVYDSVSMRAIQAYLPSTDQEVTRLDILYGFAVIRNEWLVCVSDVTT